MYHNTTESTGGELRFFAEAANSQEKKIFRFLSKNAGRHFTPSDIWAAVFDRRVPLTSVRRAITNLTNEGHIEKTSIQRGGPYGRPEFCWVRTASQLRLL